MIDEKLEKIDGNYRCPKCNGILIPTPGTMMYKGKQFPGLVCNPCNGLWDNPSKSMFDYIEKQNARRK